MRSSKWLGRVGACAAPFLLACGGDDAHAVTDDAGGGSGPLDAAAPRRDAGGVDASEAGSDLDAAPPADGGAGADADATPPVDSGAAGRLLVAGTEIGPYAVTSDGYLIYAGLKGLLGAVPLAGGSPEVISTTFNDGGYTRDVVFVSGPAVFFWNEANALRLNVWTKTAGAHTLSLASTRSGQAGTPEFQTRWAASADGQWVAFAEDAGDIAISKSDVSTGKTVVISPVASPSTCPIALEFASDGSLYARYCAKGDATATLSKVSGGPAWTKTDLATGLRPALDGPAFYPRILDPKAKTAWGARAAAPFDGDLIDVATGAATSVDTDVASSVFDPGGTAVLYATQGKNLRRATIAAPTPADLVTTGDVVTLAAFSPDAQKLLYWDASFVLHAASTTTAGAPIALSTGTGAYAAWNNDWFTADSTYALYYSDFLNTGTLDGTLHARPVDGAAETVNMKDQQGAYAIGGTRVVTADAKNGDVHVIDASGAQPPRLLATGAWVLSGPPGGWLVTPDRTQLVYARSTEGIYVLPVQ